MDKNTLKVRYSDFMNLIIALFLLATLIGCTPKRFKIVSDQLNLSNSGIVLGKITNQRFYGLFMYNDEGGGRGIGIRNKDTKEEFTYINAKYFEMRLPEGTYQISAMGTPNGGIIPKTEPFEFNIKNGEIKYIGTIVADRDLIKHLEKINDEKPVLGKNVFSIKDYGEIEIEGLLIKKPTGRAMEPFFTFYIIDEHDEVIAKFKEKYPEIKTNNVIVDFMK